MSSFRLAREAFAMKSGVAPDDELSVVAPMNAIQQEEALAVSALTLPIELSPG